MAYRLGILLGDDIGPEVVPEAVRVGQAAVAAGTAEMGAAIAERVSGR